MGRHNRDGKGADQCGVQYRVNYQPDWLRLVKVTRELDSGRQSTRTVFRNPADTRESRPGEKVRTHIVSDQAAEKREVSGKREVGGKPPTGGRPAVDFEVAIRDPQRRVTRIQVAYQVDGPGGESTEVEFTLEGDLPPSR